MTERLACKVAPTIADSTNETKNVPDKFYAEVCAIADTTNETKKIPDNVHAEVCAILAELPRQVHAVLLAQNHLRKQDRAPTCHDYEKSEFSPEGFKCYCTSKNRDPTCTDNQTIFEL